MIADEKRTIKEMISLYCRKHNHSCSPELCMECKELLEYSTTDSTSVLTVMTSHHADIVRYIAIHKKCVLAYAP